MYKRALLLTLSTFVAFGAIAEEATLKANLPETEQQVEAVESKDALAGCSCKKKGKTSGTIVAADVEQAEEIKIEEEKAVSTIAAESEEVEASEEAVVAAPAEATV